VWRTDGQLNCIHAHGMDAVASHAGHSTHFLNGLGGDYLMGAFLRPAHLLRPGTAAEAARSVLATRRFHRRAPREIFKPEVLARAAEPTEAALERLMGRYPSERLGNTLLRYWLRHYSPRIGVLGLALEAPHVAHLAPL